MTKYVLAIAAVAMLVSPAFAAWQTDSTGDFLYAAQDRYNSDGSSTWRYGTALAYLDFAASPMFYGGKTHSGYDMSEPLAQNAGYVGDDIVSLVRGVVQYDFNTALMLVTSEWGGTSTKTFLTQVEWNKHAAYEDQGLTNPGVITVYGEAGQPITDGGQWTGRLKLAVDAGVGYDPGGDEGGVDPRVRLESTIGADGLTSANNIGGLAKDEVGNLYIAGRAGTASGDARVYKIPGPGTLGNSAGLRAIDLLGAPSLLVQQTTSFPNPSNWFTGVAAGSGAVYVTNYNVQAVEVYDDTTGGAIGSVDLATPSGLLDGLPSLTPEDVRVDPSYGVGSPGYIAGTVRLVVQVLDQEWVDEANADPPADPVHPDARVDLLVLDINPVSGALLAAKALGDGGGVENGSYTYSAIDWLEVSVRGDIVSGDVRGNNDVRAHSYSAAAYAAAMNAPGLVVSIVNGTNSMWNDRCFNRAKGGAFMVPEPASMALLALGGLALIRRRK